MIPWVHLDTAKVPGGDELKLMRRGDEFSIMAGPIALMNSRMSGSEITLAELACERVGSRKHCRMLIGGYGMGFTLRAALSGLRTDSEITVAELVPEIITWARGPMAELTAKGLEDSRVRIKQGDVADVIASACARFDAILLDVDNGPDGLSRNANNRLYTMHGLKTARAALRPGGVLAIWSAAPDSEFKRRLGNAGFAVEEIIARANKGRGGRYVIWMATNADRAVR